MNDSTIEATHRNKEERELINSQTTEEKKWAMVCRKINLIHQNFFKHHKMDMPNGKVLHLGRTVGTHCAEHNITHTGDMFCMTGHATVDKISNIARDHYFTHSSPADVHVVSGATDKKDWTLSRGSCSTCELESCVYRKHSR